jgi:predicted TPR repeat methyltransferase
MSTQQLYDQWSSTYDQVINKTRDLEKIAGQQVLATINCDTVVELGCGTGKNTEWLSQRSNHLTAVDLSEEMMAKAKEKIDQSNVVFQQADITKPWNFTDRKTDLVTCSLILEHIQDLLPIFQNVKEHLKSGGHFYVCELHPFKQYSGSKARFDTAEGMQVLECYVHNISDYISAASASKLSLVQLNEWFDDNDRSSIPRLISFLFKK